MLYSNKFCGEEDAQIYFSAVCILMMLAAPISAQDLQKRLEANNKADFDTALKQWKAFSEDGNRVAQFNLGLMNKKGLGVPQDDEEAIRLNTLAAEQGVARTQANLGLMYYSGQGVLADYVVAHMWYNVGAANGNEVGAKKKTSNSKRDDAGRHFKGRGRGDG